MPVFPAFVTESVTPSLQFDEHVLILRVVWFNPGVSLGSMQALFTCCTCAHV
jgi:hypothetical protein